MRVAAISVAIAVVLVLVMVGMATARWLRVAGSLGELQALSTDLHEFADEMHARSTREDSR